MLYGGWKLFLCGLSPFVNSFENMAIFLSLFFWWTFMCPTFFLFFLPHFLCAWTFMCPFFSIAHVSFVTKYGERNHHIMWSFYFVGCNKWYNANFSQKHSKGVYCAHVNFDHESMKRSLPMGWIAGQARPERALNLPSQLVWSDNPFWYLGFDNGVSWYLDEPVVPPIGPPISSRA